MKLLADDVVEIKKNQLIVPEHYLQKRRVVELILVLILLPLLLVPMILSSLLILLFDKGPILFVQDRPGKGDKVFKMYKFRTMYKGCDDGYLTGFDDLRVTKVGKLLRKYKLDELPQLFNVLKGEMSIIGPRPVPLKFYHIYKTQIPNYSLRHVITPGITGWAQVRLGYTETLEQEMQKLLLDLEYIQNISFYYDIVIVRDTILSFFKAMNNH